MNRKKVAIVLLAVFLIALFFVYDRFKAVELVEEYERPTPEEVVEQYFEAWAKKDWPNMYATISDGFKKIDETARTLEAFGKFAGSQGIEEIRIMGLGEESNDGSSAVVAYSVEFVMGDGRRQSFSDKFTLKFRQSDVIPGWKMIHPYGPNIDTS